MLKLRTRSPVVVTSEAGSFHIIELGTEALCANLKLKRARKIFMNSSINSAMQAYKEVYTEVAAETADPQIS